MYAHVVVRYFRTEHVDIIIALVSKLIYVLLIDSRSSMELGKANNINIPVVYLTNKYVPVESLETFKTIDLLRRQKNNKYKIIVL